MDRSGTTVLKAAKAERRPAVGAGRPRRGSAVREHASTAGGAGMPGSAVVGPEDRGSSRPSAAEPVEPAAGRGFPAIPEDRGATGRMVLRGSPESAASSGQTDSGKERPVDPAARAGWASGAVVVVAAAAH